MAHLTSMVLALLLLAFVMFTDGAAGNKKGKKGGVVIGPEGEHAIGGKWYFLGPFVVGKTEVDGDPLEAYGGIDNITVGGEDVFVSELAEGGRIGWSTIKAAPGGALVLRFPLGPRANVNFNKGVQALSKLAALEFQGWLATTFTVQRAGRYLLRCAPAHHVQLDGRLLHGNVYSVPWGWSPVTLSEGTHEVKIRVRAKGEAQLSCGLRPKGPDLELYPPAVTTPDVVAGGLLGGWLLVPVLNAAEGWRDVSFSCQSSGLSPAGAKTWGRGLAEGEVPTVRAEGGGRAAPGQTLLVPVRLTLEGGGVGWSAGAPGDGACISAVLTAGGETLGVGLRCRGVGQSFIFTFRDHDGSVASAAVLRPREPCAMGGCPVLLSLSGVGVRENDQADAHKFKPGGAKGDFVFGYEGAWVLAPERDGAHNWEGTGHQTAVESLPALAALAAEGGAFAEGRGVDTSRVLFAGHSRGGHGAWIMAMHHPDRAVGVASLSGWWKREMYADANIAFDLDTQLSFVDPALRALFEAAIVDHDSSQMAQNLKGVPVIVRTGSEDGSVPPWHSRRMGRLLGEHGVDVVYAELPGKGHWWWDSETESDGGAMNDGQLRLFYTRSLSLPLPPFPSAFETVVYNPSTHLGRGGVRLLQQATPHRRTVVRGRFVAGGGGGGGGRGREGNPPPPWGVSEDGRWEERERSPGNYGPARQVFAAPFRIVVGTGGSGEEAAGLRDIAVYLAMGHAHASKTTAEVVNDTEVLREGVDKQARNLIVVGGPKFNLAAGPLLDRRPAGAAPGASFARDFGGGAPWLEVGPCRVVGPGTAGVLTAPRARPGGAGGGGGGVGLDLHVAGEDVPSMARSVRFSFAVQQALTRAPMSNMVPDFVISGPEAPWRGYGGVLAAGFWGNEWEWRGDIAYAQCGG